MPLEQFWGRAARASWVRKNPDARLIFRRLCGADTPVRGRCICFCFLSQPYTSLPCELHFAALSRTRVSEPHERSDSSLRSICGNGEVHRDAGLSFHRLPVLEVRLQVPLLHSLASCGPQDARPTENMQLLDLPLSPNERLHTHSSLPLLLPPHPTNTRR